MRILVGNDNRASRRLQECLTVDYEVVSDGAQGSEGESGRAMSRDVSADGICLALPARPSCLLRDFDDEEALSKFWLDLQIHSPISEEVIPVRAVPVWAELETESGRSPSIEQCLVGLKFVFSSEEQRRSILDLLASLPTRVDKLSGERLSALVDVSRLVSSTSDLDDMLLFLMTSATKVMESKDSSLMLLDESTNELVFKIALGEKSKELNEVRMKMGQGVCGWVAQHGKPLMVNDVSTDRRFYAGVDEKLGYKTESILCVPLKLKDKVIGVVEVLNTVREGSFYKADLELLSAFASQAAIAIENCKLYSASQNRMEKVVESMSDGVVITGSQGSVLRMNPAAKNMLGLSASVADASIDLRALPLDKDLKTIVNRCFDEIDLVAEEVTVQDFKARVLKLSSAPVLDFQGEKIGVVTVMHDITRQKEIDRMKSDFVSSVSHELRTPLTSIKGYIDNMRDGIAGDLTEKQTAYLDKAKENVDRLARLVNDVLDVSRIESGKTELKCESVELAQLTRESAQQLAPMAADKRLTVAVEAEGEVRVIADRDKISQVLINLIGNAIKFTPDAGEVCVRLRAGEDGVAEVCVTDTGEGIAPDELEMVFDRFYQGVNGSKRGGTGLGLSIAKGLVALHGGRVWAESTPGQGSSFYFTLPIGASGQ